MGIEGKSIKKEIGQLLAQLPQLYNEVAAQVKLISGACQYYQSFTKHTIGNHDITIVPLIQYIIGKQKELKKSSQSLIVLELIQSLLFRAWKHNCIWMALWRATSENRRTIICSSWWSRTRKWRYSNFILVLSKIIWFLCRKSGRISNNYQPVVDWKMIQILCWTMATFEMLSIRNAFF